MKYLITFQRHGCPELEMMILDYVMDSSFELSYKLEFMQNVALCTVEKI